MQVGSRDTEKAQEPLQRVLAAGKHLLGLINQVLDLSKIETGQLELNPQTVQLAPLIEEVAGTAKQLAEANKNRLIVDTPGDLGAQTADPIRLRQIMLNLLSNACKFTKGEVKLQARRVRNGRDWIYRPSSNYCTDIRSKGGKGHAHIDPRFMSRQRRSHVRARFCNRQSNAIRSPESTLLRSSRLFCVTTVSIVCTIKAPVPARAEDGLYRVPLIRTGAPNGRNPMDGMRQG